MSTYVFCKSYCGTDILLCIVTTFLALVRMVLQYLLVWGSHTCTTEMKEECFKSCERCRSRHVCLTSEWVLGKATESVCRGFLGSHALGQGVSRPVQPRSPSAQEAVLPPMWKLYSEQKLLVTISASVQAPHIAKWTWRW